MSDERDKRMGGKDEFPMYDVKYGNSRKLRVIVKSFDELKNEPGVFVAQLASSEGVLRFAYSIRLLTDEIVIGDTAKFQSVTVVERTEN